VAELPERWTQPAQPYRFGVAADGGATAAPRRTPAPVRAPSSHPLDHRVWQCRARARETPVQGRTWAHVRTWWASRDRGLGQVWHRVRCRYGRHDVRGGQQVQLGSRFVNVERRCVWCGALPPAASSHMTAASDPAWPGLIR
jgi:hypothetical protein